MGAGRLRTRTRRRALGDCIIEVWLDPECRYRLGVRTRGSQPRDRGSNPRTGTILRSREFGRATDGKPSSFARLRLRCELRMASILRSQNLDTIAVQSPWLEWDSASATDSEYA